jgi:hypothetical protein
MTVASSAACVDACCGELAFEAGTPSPSPDEADAALAALSAFVIDGVWSAGAASVASVASCADGASWSASPGAMVLTRALVDSPIAVVDVCVLAAPGAALSEALVTIAAATG